LERLRGFRRHLVHERLDVSVTLPAIFLLGTKLKIDDAADRGKIQDLPAAPVTKVFLSTDQSPDGSHDADDPISL
jgi:hypothetical protein